MSGERWRLILGPGLDGAGSLDSDGARNMAVDHVLLDSAKAGASPSLRLYRWAPACLSLGRNQPAVGRYDGAGRLPGRDVVRRPTGGLAVFHDQELTYSVTCRVGVLGSPRVTYRRVHEALAAGLAALGARTALSTPAASRAPAPGDPRGICFHASAAGEILADAGKLVGSAQRCERRTLLQHGSILLDGSQVRAAPRPAGQRADEGTDGAPRSAHGVATLVGLLGRLPDEAELVGSIGDAFEVCLGIRLAPATLSTKELSRLDDAIARYGSADWTWRS